MKPLTCLKCSAPIDEQNLNQELGIAKCRYCNTSTKVVDAEKKSFWLDEDQTETAYPVPPHIKIYESAQELRIFIQTRNKATNPFALNFLNDKNKVPVIVGLVFAFFISGGLILIPLVFVILISNLMKSGLFDSAQNKEYRGNRKITATKGKTLTCQPVPNTKLSQVYPVSEIRQLYCTEMEEYDYQPMTKSYKPRKFYNVNLLSSDNLPRLVLSGLETRQDALLVERKIEEFLSIPNRPVAGEIG
ncbi:MAG: hypothetical protein R3C11_15815 [Planctomycetaceae bacterium]